MKHILVLSSTFPLNKRCSINPSVKNLILPLLKNLKITLLLPDHTKLDVSDLEDKNIKIIKYKYFWPRSFQKLTYGFGIIPNIWSNPFLILEVIPFFVFQVRAIKKILKTEKIDVILANWAIPSGLSAILSVLPQSTKVIVYIHGSDANIKNFIYQKLLGFTLNRSDFVIAVSKTLAQKLAQDFNISNVAVIPQGIEISKPNVKTRKHQIVFAGRLIKNKGAKNLIDAFRILKLKHPKYKLLIIGDGPQGRYLEKYVNKNNISNIWFTGNLPNAKLLGIFRESMLFVFPSKLPEGLPNVLLEAGISKLPILTNDVGGVRDLISEQSGYFTKPEPVSIAKKINSILSNYQDATSKSNILYKKIKEKFSIQKSARNIFRIINNP